MKQTAFVTRSSELSIPAATAFALAKEVETFRYVVFPLFTVPHLDVPDILEPGVEGSARLWLFGVIPAWKHHLKLIAVGDNEIYTNEHGGPARTWNHRLTFEPLTDTTCRYTDEIEVDGGPLGLGTRVVARLLFRYRHRRWRKLVDGLG